jgi:hypothetical protein
VTTRFEQNLDVGFPAVEWRMAEQSIRRLLAVLEAALLVRHNMEHGSPCLQLVCTCGAVEFWQACDAAIADPLLAPQANTGER